MAPTAPASKNMLDVLDLFQECWTVPTWKRVFTLLRGAIVTTGARTVTNCLRGAGLSGEKNWSGYHRVLSKAPFRMLRGAQLLLGLLSKTFVSPGDPLTFVVDETLERRTGRRIKLAGWFRDAARSTESKTVTSRGVRWLVLSLMVRPAWSDRVWALPIISIPLPAEIERQKAGLKKKGPKYTSQLFSLLKRWYPERVIIIVGDGGFAVHEIYREAVLTKATILTRCRQDIMTYEPLVKPIKRPSGRPRTHGPRLPLLRDIASDPKTTWTKLPSGFEETSFQDGEWFRGHTTNRPVPVRCVLVREVTKPCEPPAKAMAISCTDQAMSPEKIVELYRDRWSTEVTFQETRAHLGFETGRGWLDNTIARTTPMILALFSLVVLLANSLFQSNSIVIRQASWYQKSTPTFIDLLASVRRELWSASLYRTSREKPLVQQLSANLARSMLDTLCYAA